MVGTDPTKPGCACDAAEDLIHLLGHDVRNCVRALRDIPEWISEDLEDLGVAANPSLSDNLSMMRAQATRLDRLLTDLMVLSRVGWQNEAEETSWPQVLEALENELSSEKRQVIECQLHDEKIGIARNDAKHVLVALLSNAFKHGQGIEGGVMLRTRIDGGFLVLSVEDRGPGISDTFVSRAFDPLTTFHPRDLVEGSGLGLAIVKKAARQAGGTACIAPAERGTIVEVALPLARPAQ